MIFSFRPPKVVSDELVTVFELLVPADLKIRKERFDGFIEFDP